jgi:hypothetical protein
MKPTPRWVTVEGVCSSCDKELKGSDQCMILTRWPQGDSDCVCVECWLTMIVTSTAWLTRGGDPTELEVQNRVETAFKLAAGHEMASGTFPRINPN